MTLDAPTSTLPLTASHADTAASPRAPHRLGSRVRLTAHELFRFQGSTLFDHIARVVCTAACLPRKELYESWEVARRAHGYSVYTQTIPAEITAKNRLLLGAPPSPAPPGLDAP